MHVPLHAKCACQLRVNDEGLCSHAVSALESKEVVPQLGTAMRLHALWEMATTCGTCAHVLDDGIAEVCRGLLLSASTYVQCAVQAQA
eukprot:3158547-Amphidinium_carterae.1